MHVHQFYLRMCQNKDLISDIAHFSFSGAETQLWRHSRSVRRRIRETDAIRCGRARLWVLSRNIGIARVCVPLAGGHATAAARIPPAPSIARAAAPAAEIARATSPAAENAAAATPAAAAAYFRVAIAESAVEVSLQAITVALAASTVDSAVVPAAARCILVVHFFVAVNDIIIIVIIVSARCGNGSGPNHAVPLV